MTNSKTYTLSIGATVRANGLPETGDILRVKEAKLFEDNYADATVLSVEKEDVNNSGNIRYTINTDIGSAEVWEHEIK